MFYQIQGASKMGTAQMCLFENLQFEIEYEIDWNLS